MVNIYQKIIDNTGQIIIGTIIVILFLIILGALASSPAMNSETQAIAEQGQQTISWMWLFYLGIPSTTLIATLIFWIKIKKRKNI